MSSYIVGTITITGGTKTVLGVGTSFLSRVSVGQNLAIWGLAGVFRITEVIDDVTLQTNTPLPGSNVVSNLAYVICDDFTPFTNMSLLRAGSIDTNQQMQRNLKILVLEVPTSAPTYD